MQVVHSEGNSSTSGRQRTFHLANALASVALIGTGLLISYPDIRAQLIGGYAMQLSKWHHWIGVAFIAMPLLWLLKDPAALLHTVRWYLGAVRLDLWRKLHYGVSLLACVILAITGAVLWLNVEIDRAMADTMVGAHVVATWVLLFTIPLHLLSAVLRVGRAKRRHAGREQPTAPPHTAA
jgi:cytochrome b subunit of formate dehydrogenase